MGRELDRRDFRGSKVTADRTAELRSIAAEVSDRLPGEQRIDITSFDPTTGNAEVVNLESAPSERGNYAERALEYLQYQPGFGVGCYSASRIRARSSRSTNKQ